MPPPLTSPQAATWEWAEDVADDRILGRFQRFQRPPSLSSPHPALLTDVRPPADQWKPYAESPKYLNGRTLRPYQLEGLNWLVFSWYQVGAAVAHLLVCMSDPLHCVVREVAGLCPAPFVCLLVVATLLK